MIRLLFICVLSLISTASVFAQGDHDHHHHASGHANEGVAHALGHVSIAGITYQVTLHGEVTPGAEAVISVEAEQGQAPKELRAWVGMKNGRGSVKALLQADSHGHFHGHLEVPAKLAHGSAIWLDIQTDSGRKRGSVNVPEAGHEHGKH